MIPSFFRDARAKTLASTSLLALAATTFAGDFNNDGFDDLALGVPGETIGAANARGGAIAVLYGTANGLTATGPVDQIFHQDSPGVPGVVEDDDAFGAAVTTGDFNGDGFDDVAIGVPDEDITGGGLTRPEVGVVTVIFGSPTGLSTTFLAPRQFQSNVLVNFAHFGAALASDDFDHDGIDDLAIGVPRDLVGGNGAAGTVQVLYGSPTGPAVGTRQVWSQDSPGILDTAEPSDRFGSSLAAADFNGDGTADLAVGAPSEDSARGIVHVLFGFNGPGLTSTSNVTFAQGVNGVPGVRFASDNFGAALSAVAHTKSPLAIGCPQDSDSPVRSGSVLFLPHGLSVTNSTFLSQNIISGFSAPTSGDRFGASVLLSDFGRSFPNPAFDLAIGAPGATVVNSGGTATTSAGAVYVLYGTGATTFNLTPQRLGQGVGLGETAETGDGFGKVLNAGNFGKDPLRDLVVGTPLENSGLGDTGVVQVVFGSFGNGLTSTGNQVWTQDTLNVEELSEAGDNFGASLVGQ
jgi:hypothetical protein